MNYYLAAAVYSTFLWWFSTGIIFYLNARPMHTFRWSMLGGSVILIGALYGLWASAGTTTVSGAYIAFTCGLLIWGWHTMSYYMGMITGPRRDQCPSNCRGWRHFIHAVETSLYHELAIIATAVLMVVLTWGQPNHFGLWTFVVLWGMHVSAKLNVFLGVRNLNKEFIPPHLSYLTGFFRRRSMNLLFPISVTVGTVITLVLVQASMASGASPFAATGYTLLATLMALAVLEHWFMILPIPAETLWRWSLDPAPVSRGKAEPTNKSRAAKDSSAVTSGTKAKPSSSPATAPRRDAQPSSVGSGVTGFVTKP